MKRTHRREFVMNDEEATDLAEKARSACMSESGLIRWLIKGYQPPPSPDKEFFDDMSKLLEASGRLADAAWNVRAADGRDDVVREAEELRKLRVEIERKYLSTKKVSIWR